VDSQTQNKRLALLDQIHSLEEESNETLNELLQEISWVKKLNVVLKFFSLIASIACILINFSFFYKLEESLATAILRVITIVSAIIAILGAFDFHNRERKLSDKIDFLRQKILKLEEIRNDPMETKYLRKFYFMIKEDVKTSSFFRDRF